MIRAVGWKREDVRAYRDRDWGAFERAPVPMTPTRARALAESLYRQVRAAVPGWPTAAERDEDLAAHIRLARLFREAHHAQRRGIDPR